MTRAELLQLVIARARANGFEFRRWYTVRIGLKWINAEAAITLLDTQRRYYALLFSHEFAIAFWKAGEDITFQVPEQTFQRVNSDGSVSTVTRKQFMRRSARRDAWRYHLKEMALAEEPLRYIRKYLNVADELVEETASGSPTPTPVKAASTKSAQRSSRPLPTDLPAFLRRPYP